MATAKRSEVMTYLADLAPNASGRIGAVPVERGPVASYWVGDSGPVRYESAVRLALAGSYTNDLAEMMGEIGVVGVLNLLAESVREMGRNAVEDGPSPDRLAAALRAALRIDTLAGDLARDVAAVV